MSSTAPSDSKAPGETLGLALLTRAASDAKEAQAVWAKLSERISRDPGDAGALLDLSTLLQLCGQGEKGLDVQAVALANQTCFRRAAGQPGAVRLLAFVAAGDLMANTPLDFLLEGANVEVIFLYLDGPPPAPETLPEHDVAFLAIGQSDANDPLLAILEDALKAWPRPVLNHRSERIAAQSRDGVARQLADQQSVRVPTTYRIAREALAPLPEGLDFPILIRPIASHAGRDLERLFDNQAVETYLVSHADREFYVSTFVDYSGADGLFRKFRIAFIRGEPFICHMAVSTRWMVHYLNADMETSPANRAEEAEMMSSFDAAFARRHAGAFEALRTAMPLDYFVIDCAEAGDGRLLLFEAGVAMIVHAMDSPALYPYKQPAMAKLFAAFVAMIETAASRGAASHNQAPPFPEPAAP